MNLLPQDVLVMLKLALAAPQTWTYDRVAYELGLSPSMVHSAVRRATQARLFDGQLRRPRRKALEEFLVHGVKYAYPADLGPVTRGVPTALASPLLRDRFAHGDDAADIHVWPHPQGAARGVALSPLHRSVPGVAGRDETLYAALGLLDAIRIGRARERDLAATLLREMLDRAAP